MRSILKSEFLSRSVIVAVLIIVAGCSSNGGSEEVLVDREIVLDQSITGGFDDFSSIGAAFGYVVDESANGILAISLKFVLPLNTKAFDVGSDFEDSAAEYLVTSPPNPIADDVDSYPLLESVTTDTFGIRTGVNEIVAVYIEGDLQQDIPAKIFVADQGTITLQRQDGPSDHVEGSLRLREVTNLGAGASEVSAGEVIEIKRIFFDWDTADQSF